jgi:hypothetical protein
MSKAMSVFMVAHYHKGWDNSGLRVVVSDFLTRNVPGVRKESEARSDLAPLRCASRIPQG